MSLSESTDMRVTSVFERLTALEAENVQLRTALASRVVIEQAKGVLAERLDVSVAEAFALLRNAARSDRTKLHEMARRVLEEKRTPAPVVVAISRAQRVGMLSRNGSVS